MFELALATFLLVQKVAKNTHRGENQVFSPMYPSFYISSLYHATNSGKLVTASRLYFLHRTASFIFLGYSLHYAYSWSVEPDFLTLRRRNRSMSSTVWGESDRNSPGRVKDLFDTECVLLCGLRLYVCIGRGFIKGEGGALSLKRVFGYFLREQKVTQGRGAAQPREGIGTSRFRIIPRSFTSYK